MSDDDSKQEQTAEERETAKNRVEREYCRMEGDDGTAVSDTESRVNEDPIRPNPAESSDSAAEGVDVEQLDVPQISISPASQFDSAEQLTELSAEGRPVQVPQIQTQSRPVMDTNEMVETPLVESKTGITDVPQFTSDTTTRFTPIELDDDQLEGVSLIQQSQIPQVTVEHHHRIQPFSTFLNTVPEITTENTDVESEVDEPVEEENQTAGDVTLVKEGAVDTPGELEGKDEWATNEWPDPLELLFGSGGSNVNSGNPLVVLVDDGDLIGSVEALVKRRYREIEGGEPELQKVNTANQLADEERWLSADGRIFTAELPDEEWEKLEDGKYQEEWQSICRNRLDQIYSGQQFGAVIFNRGSIPGLEITSHHLPTQVKLEQEVDLIDFASVYWTNVSEVKPGRARTFSQIFDWDVNGIAQERWQRIEEAADGKFKSATNNDDEASDEHYALKVFVVKWLTEQLWEANDEFGLHQNLSDIEDYREIEENIPTEQPLKVSNNECIRPDVRYESQVFEVETFFGEADESGIETKLQKTVRKYKSLKHDIDTINIVMDNLTCILHLADLAQFKRHHQPWEADHADINLYTIDLGQEDLVPISDIVDEISSLSPT